MLTIGASVESPAEGLGKGAVEKAESMDHGIRVVQVLLELALARHELVIPHGCAMAPPHPSPPLQLQKCSFTVGCKEKDTFSHELA